MARTRISMDAFNRITAAGFRLDVNDKNRYRLDHPVMGRLSRTHNRASLLDVDIEKLSTCLDDLFRDPYVKFWTARRIPDDWCKVTEDVLATLKRSSRLSCEEAFCAYHGHVKACPNLNFVMYTFDGHVSLGKDNSITTLTKREFVKHVTEIYDNLSI